MTIIQKEKNMQLTAIDKDQIIKLCPLKGVTVTEVRSHSSNYLQSIRMEDEEGHVMVVSCSGTYSAEMQVLLKVPPKKVKKWKVLGEITGGVKVDEEFGDSTSASDRKSELGRIHEGAQLEIKTVEVEVQDE